MRQHAFYIAFNFIVSFALTSLFVILYPVYVSKEQMVLSTSIAGGKWMLQIVAALLILGNGKWTFISVLSRVCLTGSIILIPFILSSYFDWNASAYFFVSSLIVAVMAMTGSYYYHLRKFSFSIYWFFLWLVLLTTAILLQLTIVFKVL